MNFFIKLAISFIAFINLVQSSKQPKCKVFSISLSKYILALNNWFGDSSHSHSIEIIQLEPVYRKLAPEINQFLEIYEALNFTSLKNNLFLMFDKAFTSYTNIAIPLVENFLNKACNEDDFINNLEAEIKALNKPLDDLTIEIRDFNFRVLLDIANQIRKEMQKNSKFDALRRFNIYTEIAVEEYNRSFVPTATSPSTNDSQKNLIQHPGPLRDKLRFMAENFQKDLKQWNISQFQFFFNDFISQVLDQLEKLRPIIINRLKLVRDTNIPVKYRWKALREFMFGEWKTLLKPMTDIWSEQRLKLISLIKKAFTQIEGQISASTTTSFDAIQEVCYYMQYRVDAIFEIRNKFNNKSAK